MPARERNARKCPRVNEMPPFNKKIARTTGYFIYIFDGKAKAEGDMQSL